MSTLKQIVEHEGAEALPRWCWIFIHGCMLLICFVICNIIRLLWVGVVDHCVDSYHFLGVYTELAALTFAPQFCCGRATAHFPLGWWRRWSREPMTAIYLLPLLPRHWSILLALWLSPETSTPFFALPYHFKMHLETLPHFRLGATLVHLKPLCEPFGVRERWKPGWEFWF